MGHSLVVGRLEDPRPTVALVGHLDTVPAHPSDGPPRIEGERVFGLGASDMKGGLAVMMALAEDLPLRELPVNLVLILYEREEGPYLESGLGPLFEQRPELKRVRFGIAMEPTDGLVQVGCVGTLHATLKFTGRSAHSARPWQGENAIHKAGPLLTELLARQRVEVLHAGFAFFEVMSVTLAHGGRARNVVPDTLELNLNYRFAPGKSLEQAQDGRAGAGGGAGGGDVHGPVAERAGVRGQPAVPAAAGGDGAAGGVEAGVDGRGALRRVGRGRGELWAG